MTNDNAAPSKGFVELLAQALVNPELRAKVLNSPESLTAEYDLLPSEVNMLRRSNNAAFDRVASGLNSETESRGHFTAVDGAAFDRVASGLNSETESRGFFTALDGASFDRAASKLGGETAALVKGFFDGDEIQTVTRRREPAPLAKAA